MESVIFRKRIKCECGWYNNRPAKINEKHARCSKCGKPLFEEYRTTNKKREFEFGVHKALFNLRRKEI